jgi:hypothetical protein
MSPPRRTGEVAATRRSERRAGTCTTHRTRERQSETMAGYYPRDQRQWLLQIGQRLRFDYADIIAAPLPERLAALLKQLEEATDSPRKAA